jgi:acyl-CoA thioesterase-1
MAMSAPAPSFTVPPSAASSLTPSSLTAPSLRVGLAIQGLALLALACGTERPERPDPVDSPDRVERDAEPGSETAPPTDAGTTVPTDERGIVLFLGNSLTAGLGVNPQDAFPARIQSRIDSAGLPYHVVNAGLGGETSAGGLRHIEPLLESKIRVLVLALGANDALRGVPPDSMRRNLQAIIDRATERYPDCRIVIAGMQAPPNLGETYTRAFREVFPALARANDAALIPFLLEGVAADTALNQADGIHPTAEGHEIMAETVWRVLRVVLRGVAGGDSEIRASGASKHVEAQAATLTYAAYVEGSGTGSPPARSDSRWNSSAARISCSTDSRLGPVATQPCRSGE